VRKKGRRSGGGGEGGSEVRKENEEWEAISAWFGGMGVEVQQLAALRVSRRCAEAAKAAELTPSLSERGNTKGTQKERGKGGSAPQLLQKIRLWIRERARPARGPRGKPAHNVQLTRPLNLPVKQCLPASTRVVAAASTPISIRRIDARTSVRIQEPTVLPYVGLGWVGFIGLG